MSQEVFRSTSGSVYRKLGAGDYERTLPSGQTESIPQQAFAGAVRQGGVRTKTSGEQTARYVTSSGNVFQKFEGDDGNRYFKNGQETSRQAYSGGTRTVDRWEYKDLDDFEFDSTRDTSFSTIDKQDYFNIQYGASESDWIPFEAWDPDEAVRQLAHIVEEEIPRGQYDRFSLGVRAEIETKDGRLLPFTPRTIEEPEEYRQDLYVGPAHWPNVVTRLAAKDNDYEKVRIKSVFAAAKSL